MADRLSKAQKNWIRWTKWEFWPFSLLYFPVGFYYTWLSIKRGSFFFFTSANPSIEFGGMLGEKKSEIYDMMPPAFIPKTKLFQNHELESAAHFAESLGYPVILKPDIGERGILVEKINDRKALKQYTNKCPVPFLVQELVEYPVELGIFYTRLPSQDYGKISSIVKKDFLSVTGDGHKTVFQLLEENPRASLLVDMDHPRISYLLDSVPKPGKYVQIEPIGNHSRGTTFLNGMDLITPKLEMAFDKLTSMIPGFFFGRFDIKCQSLGDLEDLKNFKIIELNGAGSEPGHIYQPGYSLLKAYKDINWHLATLARISHENKLRGHPYWSFKKGLSKLNAIRKYNRLLN